MNNLENLLKQILPALLVLVEQVGKEICKIYYQAKPLQISFKEDQSPVTEADMIAHRLITQFLGKLTPTIPILSEESSAITYAERSGWVTYWLIDPLDGTKEFLAGNGEFTINIALIHNHQSVAGFIHQPTKNITYYAITSDAAYKKIGENSPSIIKAKSINHNKLFTIASRRHQQNNKLQQFLNNLNPYERISCGSALKFCLIAEGVADIYPRFGDTAEWDTAAGQCLVEAAGGYVISTNMQPLRYNMRPSLINPYFIAVGDNLSFWHDYLKRSNSIYE